MKHPLLLLVFMTCLVGCGRNHPETSEVTGKILFKGQPVPCGRICFWPKGGRPALSEIAADGSYVLRSFEKADGAIAGEHRVSIKATRVHFAREGATSSKDVVVERLIPQHFERPETSGLTATVRSGKNTIDFDLPGER